jgi:CheY-like chemotaxis protein/CheY-specific phosphatase CheX
MSGNFKDKKVLITENSAVIYRIIFNVLVKMGFHPDNIKFAQDGHQAYALMTLVNFDLITSSVHLRIKDGCGLLRTIRSSDKESIRDIPFIFISSEDENDVKKWIDESQYNLFVKKPFKNDDIRQAVQGSFPTEDGVSDLSGLSGPISESVVEGFGQYMVSAVADDPIENDCLYGDMNASIDLIDHDEKIKVSLILFFPEVVACDIYETIFGERNEDDSGEVVLELSNIIGGNMKPTLTEHSKTVLDLVFPNRAENAEPDRKLKLDLGFPTLIKGESYNVNADDKDAFKLVLPFKIGQEDINALVSIQKF